MYILEASHDEQVWKKTLQPPPLLAVYGHLKHEYEVHCSLLHLVTGELPADALRGNLKELVRHQEHQKLSFDDLAVVAKPRTLTKRCHGQSDAVNRYRMLFSVWSASARAYVSWMHIDTSFVIRNSFHMLSVEEKEYRRSLYFKNKASLAAPQLAPSAATQSFPKLSHPICRTPSVAPHLVPFVTRRCSSRPHLSHPICRTPFGRICHLSHRIWSHLSHAIAL